MPKSGPLRCFWPPVLRYLESIFSDETQYTSSLGQNLDSTFFFSRQHLWSHLQRVLKAQILSNWEEFQSRKILRLKIQTQFFNFLDKSIRWIFKDIFLKQVWKQDFSHFFYQSLLMMKHTFRAGFSLFMGPRLISSFLIFGGP